MRTAIALSAHDSIINLEQAVKKTRDHAEKVRIMAIILRARGVTPQEIATRLVVTDRSVTGWINKYNQGGRTALATKPSGRPKGNPTWDMVIFDALAKEIDTKKGYWSVPLMQRWIRERYDKNIPEQTVWYRMDQLDYSYKSARPHPYRGDREKQNAFKKGVWYRSSRH